MNYPALSDFELVTLLQQEDEEAFAELYNRYWKRIYSLAFTYTKSQEASKDIVQEVFLKLWVKKDKLSHVQEFKPYLFVAARNHIISSLRNKVFHSSLDDDDLLQEEILVPEKQLSYKESVALLYEAVNLLPPQQKRAYELSRNEGKKQEEIAAEMGLSLSTVKIHISKALGFIRHYLINHSVHPVVLILLMIGKK